jgi:hypothetical protein
VKVEDIWDYDLSAKNPNKAKEIALESPSVIVARIGERNKNIEVLHKELSKMIQMQ